MTKCRKCDNRRNCWIKDIIEFKAPVESEQQRSLAMGALRDECELYSDEEDGA